MNNLKKLKDIILAIIATVGLVYYMNLFSADLLTNNIIYIPLFFLYIYVYKKMPKNKRATAVACILAVISSNILVIGEQLERSSDIFWGSGTIIKIISLVFSIIPVFSYAIKYIEKYSKKANKLETYSRKKMFVTVFLILFFFGFLGFLALYPGQYGYDARLSDNADSI